MTYSQTDSPGGSTRPGSAILGRSTDVYDSPVQYLLLKICAVFQVFGTNVLPYKIQYYLTVVSLLASQKAIRRA